VSGAARRLAEHEWFLVGDDEIVIRKYPGEDDYMVFEGRIQPGGGPPTLHTHRSSELFYTLAGELTYFVQRADGSLDAIGGPPATTAFIESGAVHTYRNLGSEEARYIAVVRPGTDLAAFFNEAAVGVGDPRRAPEEIDRIYAAYGEVTDIDPARA